MLGAIEPALPHLPSTFELCQRILLAALLGGLIGFEREINDHPSGLRTHIAVSMGAAMFGICSAYAFGEFVALRNDNNYQIDVTRVASQVVVGVGFLGGGAIVKQGNTVHGLTSAAGLWVSAAVGLAVSLGLYVEAVVTVIALLAALVLLKGPIRWLRGRWRPVNESVVVTLGLDSDPSPIISAFGSLDGVTISSLNVRRHADEGFTAIEADVIAPPGYLRGHLGIIANLPGVTEIEIG